jgi:hypothetical protein
LLDESRWVSLWYSWEWELALWWWVDTPSLVGHTRQQCMCWQMGRSSHSTLLRRTQLHIHVRSHSQTQPTSPPILTWRRAERASLAARVCRTACVLWERNRLVCQLRASSFKQPYKRRLAVEWRTQHHGTHLHGQQIKKRSAGRFVIGVKSHTGCGIALNFRKSMDGPQIHAPAQIPCGLIECLHECPKIHNSACNAYLPHGAVVVDWLAHSARIPVVRIEVGCTKRHALLSAWAVVHRHKAVALNRGRNGGGLCGASRWLGDRGIAHRWSGCSTRRGWLHCGIRGRNSRSWRLGGWTQNHRASAFL